MSDRWGVNCGTCTEFIDIGPLHEIGSVAGLVPPSEPIYCECCGASHTYTANEVVDEDGVPLVRLLFQY